MKSDDIAIPSIPEIRTISPLSTPRDQTITTSEDRASNSSSSSDSSLSDLKRRLEDLPSPNEFSLLADRMAALGRRIGRKRELFLRLHGVANRIEENDEWEEGEQRAEPWKTSSGASRSKDARARRRARVRLESSPRRDDKEMVISQAGDPISPSEITDDDKSNLAESSVNRSARDGDCLRLPAIAFEGPRRQSRTSSLSEPPSTRYSYHNNGAISTFHSYRGFTPRESASKSTDLPSVSPFSLNSIRPKKFGGYRPSSGVVLKNLSSGSESESVNEANRGLSSSRKIDNSIVTLELSSPESKVAAIKGPLKKMPIMSARNDITGSILPNLLPSSRSLGDDNLDRQISQDTLRSCVIGQINRDDVVFNERAERDEIVTKTCNEIEPKHKDTQDERKEMPQNILTFSARSFPSESAELVTNICNERIHDDPIMKTYNEFKQIESDLEDKRDQKEETESYRCIASKIHRDGIEDQFIFDCPMNRSKFQINSSGNVDRDVLDTSGLNRLTNLRTQEVVETPHLAEKIQSDTFEEALSSRASGAFESEGHSRSSCTGKIYLQKEALSSRGSPNNDVDTSDNCDQEIITKVPALALNSQDISYSTSAGSQEYSATRPLDPHALIRALSDVSLKRKRQGENDTIDALIRTSDFPAKGETWRVPRSSPRKSLSRVPSRIPIRIDNKTTSTSSANKLSEYYKYPENYEEVKFIHDNGVRSEVNESVVGRRSNMDPSPCQVREQDSSLKSRKMDDEDIEIKSGTFASYQANNHEFIMSSNPQSTPFGDYVYDRTRFLEARSGGKIYSPVLFNKAAYSGDRDYAKIDDDVRSRSDRSVSRKSADTVDVTSATESPFKFKNKRSESFRNAEENVTWRTEDDCASINDEENAEDVKDKDYYNANAEKSKELYSRTKEHLKLAMERTCDPSFPFTIQHLQLNPSSEMETSARKQQAGDDLELTGDQLNLDSNLKLRKVAQSENLTFQIRKKQEPSRMSLSAFNLNCELKRNKKSQERFPFTISEASAALSSKHQDTSDYPLPDKNLDCTEETNDQLKEKIVESLHQLQMHPSITRLATSGLEDTMEDILCCVAQEQKEAESSSKSRLKAFVRIFSSKLRKASKQSNDNKTLEPAKVIYENRACQVDSKATSCSGDSLTGEAHGNLDQSWSNRRIDCRVARSSSTLVPSGNALKKTENLQAITRKHPYRRYDRDNVWIQDIKDLSSDTKNDNDTSQKKNETDNSKENSSQDPYSIFLAKNFQSDKLSESKVDHSYFPKQQDDVLISDYVAPSDEQGKQSIDQKIPSIAIPEDTEDPIGCLCWRLCRIIAPSKYRSSIREQVPSSKTKRSGFLLWKRKK
ncbi:hypothetical protein EAG_15349 [Camponotus floridanus]|uniref:Uncharacterized protein n=1 Tax=Camponotus floridanus TaxID=104421 RepID=E2AYU9_CAMFO|nr:hypothetical protein EAG_15349 [Camponotus floridanus]